MSSVFSTSWYRVAQLRLRLRPHIEVHRQPVGEERTYLLQDHTSGKLYRFNAVAYDIIARLDGQTTVHDAWEASVASLEDGAPTQDETVSLLGRLHAANALQGDVTPDCMELFRRAGRERDRRWKRLVRSPLSLKLPLYDPDKLLDSLMTSFGALFTVPGLLIWLLAVGSALVATAVHWTELTFEARDIALAPKNLLMLALIYPLVKALHELGHGITTKKWGGEVHEMGVTFLVFVPVPYVDASASAIIASKWKRVVVSAAGMMVEIFVASIALLVWLNADPGTIRDAAFNVMLIAGVSTLLFNGNPLIKFDAYYILEDAIEIPSLATRSTRYLAYLAQRYLLGIVNASSPVKRPAERYWFLSYGIVSAIYRWFITITIIWFVAGQYFLVGVLLAAWAAVSQLLVPFGKCVAFILFSPVVRTQRTRALVVSSVLLATLTGLFTYVPIPAVTLAQGVAWPSEQSHVRSGASGIVTTLLAKPMSTVVTGQHLIQLENSLLEAELEVLRATIEELETRRRTARAKDRVKAAQLEDDIAAKTAEIAKKRVDWEQLVVKSPTSGMFVLSELETPIGSYVQQGDRIGFVVKPNSMTLQVVVPEESIGRVSESLAAVNVMLAQRMGRSLEARLTRVVPAATTTLPSKILGTMGGGSIAVDPTDQEGLTTKEPVFQCEIEVDEAFANLRIGERAYVRFDHGTETVARQMYRWARQLFLGQFSV